MIQVEDKYGKNITVTNLPEAIQQADYFRDFAHTDKVFKRFDQERQVYWQDLYDMSGGLMPAAPKLRFLCQGNLGSL